MEVLTHTFEPVCDENSRVLILGSFPSVRSRETGFYYGHAQNRFWKVTAALTDQPVPETVEEKKAMLLKERIAIWDVIASCQIKGSSDSSIRSVTPNDVAGLLRRTKIDAVFANGEKAWSLYEKYCADACRKTAVKLPSTSPANAAWPLARLIERWRELILPFLSVDSHGERAYTVRECAPKDGGIRGGNDVYGPDNEDRGL